MSSHSNRQQYLINFALGSFLVILLIVILWGLKPAMNYLAIAFGLAYTSFPIIQKLENIGIHRKVSIVSVFVGVLMVLCIGVVFFADYLYQEIVRLIESMPKITEILISKVQYYFDKFNIPLPIDQSNLLQTLQQQVDKINADAVSSLVNGLLNIIISTFSSTTNLLITISSVYLLPLFYFHLINDYEQVMNNWQKHIPNSKRRFILDFISKVDEIFQQYFRGLLTLVLIRAAVFAIGLMLIGVQQGFIIGLATGLLSFIPYIGIGLGLVTAVAVAIATASSLWIIVAILLFFGIFILLDEVWLRENFLEKQTGLSQLGVLLSIIIASELFGVWGLFLAMPIAAIIRYIVLRIFDYYNNQSVNEG